MIIVYDHALGVLCSRDYVFGETKRAAFLTVEDSPSQSWWLVPGTLPEDLAYDATLTTAKRGET